ncbi:MULTISPECIES: efflux RND transporter periplasmic adaptor subunit [Sulfurospirillum]|uniref:Efflux system, membrane fusion protein n=2 Tax=Sulfurospirillum multivorans TaxID=66821 RepID=A0AA86ANU0_SULMK|nr:efflux RND transporter periplasmic adaptor subunit [Sulfurospirillum multivorans]AHJ14285.1 efflux system, membrane fusion protein [Sulfurospirillum multivorans DSM 12446]QEH07770.1 efflux system, membrane fusion protein [Sulfurospirillum multivorans]
MNRASVMKNTLILVAIMAIGSFFYFKVYLPKITFASISPIVQDVNETAFGVGTIEAKEMIVLAPKTTAKVLSLFADQGEIVVKGKALAVMDPSDLLASKEEALMAMKKSQMSLLSQQSLLKDLEAKYTLAHTTLIRYQHLISEGFVAQAELDTAFSAEQSAKAQMENATWQVSLMQADIARNEALVKNSNAKIEDLTLKAPETMVVLSRDAEVGSTVLSGSPVFRLINPNAIWVKIYINERQSGTLHVGQSASITLRSHSSTPYRGHIARIGLESDRITEEREVDIAFDQPQHPLYVGERAEATIELAQHTRVLTLPLLALTTHQGVKGVWLANEGHAHFKPLSFQTISANGLIIVTEGVTEKDTILVPAGRDITEGMRIKL